MPEEELLPASHVSSCYTSFSLSSTLWLLLAVFNKCALYLLPS